MADKWQMWGMNTIIPMAHLTADHDDSISITVS